MARVLSVLFHQIVLSAWRTLWTPPGGQEKNLEFRLETPAIGWRTNVEEKSSRPGLVLA